MRLWSSGLRHPASNRDFRGFESFRTRQLLGVSYRGLLYLTLNQEDVGSNPTAPTNYGLEKASEIQRTKSHKRWARGVKA